VQIPERQKDSQVYLFTLLGSASAKAVHRSLMKLSLASGKAAHKKVGEIDTLPRPTSP